MIKKIYLIHHTHTDIGYTGIYSQLAAQHIRNMRSIIKSCQGNDRFRWTIEAGWPLEMFLSYASATEKKKLAECFQKGQIELTGFYNQPLTQLCTFEELCASVELTHKLADELPATIETAMLNDVGGVSYNIPQILNYYGIKYLVNGCGGWRVMLPFTTLPHLFYLEGPDGSKVLYYHIRDDVENRQPELGPAQYGFGIIYFLWPMLKEIDGQQKSVVTDGEKTIFDFVGREGIDVLLERLARQNYPYDILLLQAGFDNGGAIPRLMEAIDEWNARYGEPEIVLGTCREFFTEIENRYNQQIPTIQGELTCSWTEQAITNAQATGRYRDAKRKLFSYFTVEIASKSNSPKNHALWWDIMKNLLFYSDHTFGLSMWSWQEKVSQTGSLWSEVFDLSRYSWEIKTGYADMAYYQISRAKESQNIKLTGDDTDCPDRLSVFNPHSFDYCGIIKFYTTQKHIELIRGDGAILPVESIPVNSKWHLHKAQLDNIPAYGLEVFQIRETSNTVKPQYFCEDWELKCPSMTARIDPKTGGICSLQTECPQKEWVDASYAYLNEIYYYEVQGVATTPFRGGLDEPVTQHRCTLSAVRQTGHFSGIYTASILIERKLDVNGITILCETQYILDASGLHIRNRIRKIHTLSKEACYFAFPFQMQVPYRFDVNQQGQTTKFPDERLAGASNHNLGMQDFVSLSDAYSSVLLTSKQACLIALSQPSYYHFGLEYQKIDRPAIFSYVFNNLWNTNCPLHQQGDLIFEYHIACFDKPYDPVIAYQTSRKFLIPAQAYLGDLRELNFKESASNLFEISTDNVIVESIRPEADNNIWQIKLVEIARKATECKMILADERFAKFAIKLTHSESPQWQTIRNNTILLNFKRCECKTLLLKRSP